MIRFSFPVLELQSKDLGTYSQSYDETSAETRGTMGPAADGRDLITNPPPPDKNLKSLVT